MLHLIITVVIYSCQAAITLSYFKGRKQMVIPYSSSKAIRIYRNSGFDCERVGISNSREFDIPMTCLYLGRLGYIEIYWRASR